MNHSETELLGQLQSDSNSLTNIKTATAIQSQQIIVAPAGPNSFLGSAGSPDYKAVPALPCLRSGMSSNRGHTIYDTLVVALEDQQTNIARIERSLGATVVHAVADCRSTKGEPF